MRDIWYYPPFVSVVHLLFGVSLSYPLSYFSVLFKPCYLQVGKKEYDITSFFQNASYYASENKRRSDLLLFLPLPLFFYLCINTLVLFSNKWL